VRPAVAEQARASAMAALD